MNFFYLSFIFSCFIIIIEEVMGKNWKPEEIALACKAYVDLTRNLIQGADQCLIDFSSDLMEKYKAV